LLQPRRRCERRDRTRDRVRRHLQPRHLLRAALAARQVPLEHLDLGLGQGAQQIGADLLPIRLVSLLAHTPTTSPSWRLSFSRPSLILPFTVPTGISSISAICVCVNPPK